MSGSDSKRYQPVSVEDWDDEAQAPLPGTRTTANVAVKRDSFELDYPSSSIQHHYDGTDSGYGSKAPTVSSMASSSRKRTSDLKIDTTNPIERERKPYLVSAVRPNPDRPSSTRPKETKEAKDSKPAKKFCHEKGKCWVCDKYGYHFDPKLMEKKDVPKPAAAQQSTSQPTSQPTQQTRVIAQRTKTDDVMRPPARRMSSIQSRPASMYVGTPVHAPFPQYVPNAWPTATTPVVAYSPYYVTPPTPMTHGYLPPQQYFYEPQPVFDEPHAPPPKIVRRPSTANHERPGLDKNLSRTSSFVERTASYDKRPQVVSQVSHRSIKTIEADRLAMPPPPKPTHALVAVARPRPGRSNTYHSNVSSNRRFRYEEEEEDDEDDDDDEENEDYIDPRAYAVHREPPSPSRPPSSYRRQALQEVSERPQLREKAQSYQDGSNGARAATHSRQDHMPRRRTTESVLVSDRREAEAEAYIRKRGSMPVVDLTAENLKVLKNHITRNIPDQRSESGSTTSHVTHQSSSKDSSSGRGRAVSAMSHAPKTSMNININGLNLNITDGGFDKENGPPVKIDLGAMQISMNNRDKENLDYRKSQQKQIENGSSMSSNPSRRSLTNSSIVSANAGQRRDRDDHILAIEPPLRRTSYVEDEDDEVERTRELLEQLRRSSAKSSRQQSRDTSSARPAENRPVRRETFSNRSSVDYSLRRDEPVM